MRPLSTVTAAALAFALTGCAENGIDAFATREAGQTAGSASYGAATEHNTAVQAGLKRVMIDLSDRFASEAPTSVTFAFNSARLDASARAALSEQARWIRRFPEIRFRVYGHTDLVGAEAYNDRLGLRRAQAVVGFLAAQGVGRDRLEALASFGEREPLVDTEARERRNRRAVTEVSGFVATGSDQPLDGRYASLIYRTYTSAESLADFDREGQK